MRRIIKHVFFTLALLALTLSALSCGLAFETPAPDLTESAELTDAPVMDLDPEPNKVWGIDGAELITGVNCRNVLLSEADTLKAVASKNSSELMYPASMTKVMTFIVAYENAASLDDKTAISKEMKNKYPDASRIGIDIGDILTTEQLLYALILESDTDAAIALAEYVSGSEEEFVKLMNAKCEELGLVSTRFANVTGLHDPEHYTTAAEMTSIFAYALNIPLFKQVVTTETYVTYLEYYKDGVLTEYRMTFQNTTISPVKGRFAQNKVSMKFGDGRIIGGKTGYTDEAKHCLALLVDGGDGKEYILITAKAPNAKTSASDCLYVCQNYIK